MVKIMRRLSLTGGTKEPARSKAVDDLLDTDLDLDLANSSMRSFASSITSPPSQSGSFYHRVQKQNEASELEQKYGYDRNNMTGNIPDDWVSESTDDEDAHSTNSWGGFPNKSSAQTSDATSDSGLDSSVRSSPVPTRKGVKKSRMKKEIKNSNLETKKKKKIKKKKRLKDFFRKSAEKHEPITEVDEADLMTANSEHQKEGLEGSMSLNHPSDHPKGGDEADDTNSYSDHHSAAHSQYSKGSSKSGKQSKTSQREHRRKGGRRNVSPASRASNSSPRNSPRTSPKNSPRLARGRKKKDKKGSLDRGSAHSGPQNNNNGTPKQNKVVRRGSFGALTRRMSLGNKSDDGDHNFGGDASEQPTKNTRRGSIGGATEGGETKGRRGSLGSMLGNVVRRASLGGHDSSATPKQKGPVIPEEYHNIIHRERAARNMYLFQRDFVLDTIAQGIANDLAAGRAPTPCEFYGNIGKGTSLQVIHSKIMEERKGVSRKNILSQRFKSFGMGLAIGGAKNESIFMCTLFRE